MSRLNTILITLFIFSWGLPMEPKKHSKNSTHITDLSDKTDRRNYLSAITNVNVLINTLNNTSILEDKNIGFTGEPSLTYGYYLRLEEIANDSILIALTYHPNPKMRIYAMWALAIKNKKLALLQMQRIKNDEAWVEYQSGCITAPASVCELAARNFDSSEVQVHFRTKHGFMYAEVEVK